MGLTGWTPYPCSSARADAPRGPFAALGQTPSPCAFSAPHPAPATPGACCSPNAFARVPRGPGLYAPGSTATRLGPLSARASCLARLPSCTSRPGGRDAATAERPAQPWRVLSALGRCAADRTLTRALRTLPDPRSVQATALGQGLRPSCHRWFPQQIAGELKPLFTPPAACPGCFAERTCA